MAKEVTSDSLGNSKCIPSVGTSEIVEPWDATNPRRLAGRVKGLAAYPSTAARAWLFFATHPPNWLGGSPCLRFRTVESYSMHFLHHRHLVCFYGAHTLHGAFYVTTVASFW